MGIGLAAPNLVTGIYRTMSHKPRKDELTLPDGRGGWITYKACVFRVENERGGTLGQIPETLSLMLPDDVAELSSDATQNRFIIGYLPAWAMDPDHRVPEGP